jgi:SAM-dependent methyltransferase
MDTITSSIKRKFFKSEDHPYRIFEKEISKYLQRSHILLDAGCGREASLLKIFKDKAEKLIGIDIVEFNPNAQDTFIELLTDNLSNISLKNESVDIVFSRSVLEHLKEPLPVYSEIYRILRYGGYFIFLTPNLYHYTAVIAKLIPNRFHPWIVSRTKGRIYEDTFPVYYKSNTFKSINYFSKIVGFKIISFKYTGQYPSYFIFNSVLFLLATMYEKLLDKLDILRIFRGWLLVVLKK